jgi:hypothetical protein
MSYESSLSEMADALKAYCDIRSHKQPLEDILVDQANKLSCSNFGPDNQGLFQEAAALAPTKEYLMQLPMQRNWLISHPGRPIFTRTETYTISRGKNKGQQRTRKVKGTQTGEMETRIKHRFYQAQNWLSSKLSKYATGGMQNKDRATVEVQTEGEKLEIAIRNNAEGAAEVAEKTGYIIRAIQNRTRDMQVHIQRHLDDSASEFNRKTFRSK